MKNSIEAEHIVRVRTDEKTDKPLGETWWTTNNLRHRKNSAAQMTWDPDSGVLVREAYYMYDQSHREDGPSRIHRHPKTGEVIGEAWSIYGSFHREDGGPALWYTDPDSGYIVTEEYWVNGLRHREDGPAEICRDATTGETLCEVYYKDGRLIKDTEPNDPNRLDI